MGTKKINQTYCDVCESKKESYELYKCSFCGREFCDKKTGGSSMKPETVYRCGIFYQFPKYEAAGSFDMFMGYDEDGICLKCVRKFVKRSGTINGLFKPKPKKKRKKKL